jgi:DNA-binding response OmpR family regulator
MILAKQKLLLVDDSKEDRFLIKQSFADCGLDCDVEEACDGEEAELHLSRCMNEDTMPQFVILDLVLPKRSGIEVLEKLSPQGLAQRTKIIVLSSILPETEHARLRKLGVWQVFEKPIDLDEFLALGRRVKDLSSGQSISSGEAEPER